jgi:polysaccharide export outer membrane protein
MLQKSISLYSFFVLILLMVCSCANKKKIIYFQGDKPISSNTETKYLSILHADDLLSITVMGPDADAAKPFNLSTYGNYTSNQNNSSTNAVSNAGYLIDAGGQIDFPVIGKIKLAGLNRTEAADLIKEKLKDYIKDAMVNIQILNFKVTVLGDVNKPGTYNIPNERITFLEAIGLAGDLNLSGLRKNILLIRDVDGKKTETRIDLTSKDVFNSPAYYLQQNDVIYVEHNRAKKNASVINASSISIFVSLTSILITLATLISRN